MSVRWCLSQWDNQVHAFPEDQRSPSYSEALCEHSAPNTRITRTDKGARCVACLLIHGDALADRLGDAARWAM